MGLIFDHFKCGCFGTSNFYLNEKVNVYLRENIKYKNYILIRLKDTIWHSDIDFKNVFPPGSILKMHAVQWRRARQIPTARVN